MYNERENIVAALEQACAVVPTLGFGRFEIIVVDDGSKDGSDEVVREWGEHAGLNGQFRVVRHPENQGYGQALRSGFERAVYYRTHILSRVWASMAISILAGWAGRQKPGLRWAASAIVTAFVFFGTWGGIERQDFFLASWRGHQRELASILNAAPSLRPGTAVILRSTATSGRYLATEADYLTKHWLGLLYNDPKLRAMRLNPMRQSGCKPTAGGVDCWMEGEAICFANKTCEPTHFQFADLVVMDYDSSSGTWHLVPSLSNDRRAVTIARPNAIAPRTGSSRSHGP